MPAPSPPPSALPVYHADYLRTPHEVLTDHRFVSVYLSAEVARLSRALTDWQDIATAPKDGTTVILWWQVERRDVVSYWACGRWVEYGDGSKGWSGDSFYCSEPGSWTRLIGERPTHWRPLPAAPERPNNP